MKITRILMIIGCIWLTRISMTCHGEKLLDSLGRFLGLDEHSSSEDHFLASFLESNTLLRTDRIATLSATTITASNADIEISDSEQSTKKQSSLHTEQNHTNTETKQHKTQLSSSKLPTPLPTMDSSINQHSNHDSSKDGSTSRNHDNDNLNLSTKTSKYVQTAATLTSTSTKQILKAPHMYSAAASDGSTHAKTFHAACYLFLLAITYLMVICN
ncbi:hypothetical protein COEREDRAFT_84223 [Coemansia reversa NRRL 1564]|uniref:Uncharacterized protein n=1 Tax=Coemansia reversa (strain ATCC 12441 / NRRL 1564) TaxID=763665 RepID=A0A2G5BKR0_COERN|nr:hypothetical protein COEREDRAFT_84223 [Coemansia reversa NRRL 1564]|eukprot:PIA19590.1 hypothetical protein COEREDRAFT_84223 [Coemansia reversa NRRL 1564]